MPRLDTIATIGSPPSLRARICQREVCLHASKSLGNESSGISALAERPCAQDGFRAGVLKNAPIAARQFVNADSTRNCRSSVGQ